MNFKFQCPHCGQRISATDDFIGTDAVCPTCAQNFVVPSPAELPSVSLVPTANHFSPSSKRQFYIVSIAIFAVFIGIFVMSWLHSSRKASAASVHTNKLTPSAANIPKQDKSIDQMSPVEFADYRGYQQGVEDGYNARRQGKSRFLTDEDDHVLSNLTQTETLGLHTYDERKNYIEGYHKGYSRGWSTE